MKIAVDLDGVCADIIGGILPYAKIAMPGVKREDFTDYGFKSVGFDSVMLNEIFTMWGKTGDYLQLEPIAGAIEGVNKLNKKHEVYMISARNHFSQIHKHTEFWLNKHNFNYKRLYTGATDKKTLMGFLNIDLAIDDSPRHIEEISNSGIKVLLYDALYNKDIKNNKLIKRVYSWQDILEELE